MSDKANITIEFKLDNLKGVQECDTREQQLKTNHYRKIQETEEGQELIQELVNVINSIGNIDNFTQALKQYITRYAIFKEKYSSINFKIRDIKFKYNDHEDATLNEIITTTFNGNNELIKLYGGIIEQFDRVCENLDKVFNMQCNLDSFETFMDNLSLQTISPLTIELCNQIISNQINKISNTIGTQCKTPEDTNRLNACKNKFIELQNGTQTVRKELKNLSNGNNKDLDFSKHSNFNKNNNYLSIVKDEYNRNYLHYAWNHFEGTSLVNKAFNNIKVRLEEYAGNSEDNITRACQEKDVYGLTPLCYVLINAFDNGVSNRSVNEELKNILEYFNGFSVNTKLTQEELEAIFDYFQITKNTQGEQRDYDEFVNIMENYIQKVQDINKNKNYEPQIKYKAQTNKEQIQSKEVSIETFLSDNGNYKDKVGDFVDSLFNEIYNSVYENEFNKYFIGKDAGYNNFNGFKNIYDTVNCENKIISEIASIQTDEKLKYIPNNSTHNNINRNNYCISLFIKALEQTYNNTNNPDIMFKFLSDFCEKDMGIKMYKSNYIQVIEYFLNNPSKITDNVRQNIRSLTRYMIENSIVSNNDFQINERDTNNFIQQIITKYGGNLVSSKEQEIIQDIILTANDNGINFGSTSQQLINELSAIGFDGGESAIDDDVIQQNLSSFEIVKNLILSGNIKENENFSQYNGLTDDEKAKLQQILAKTVAVTKIIGEGKQDCSKLKDAVVKFVSGNTDLTIEDIEKIKINHKSISKFCEENVNNKKCAYYSWFLNKLVVNNYIANNPSGNTIERTGSSEQLLRADAEHVILPKDIVLDTYDEFENYKNNTIKKSKLSQPHKIFQVRYMNNLNDAQTTSKRSKIHYQDIRPVYDYSTQQSDNSNYYGTEASKTLKSIVSNAEQDDIQTDLKNYKLQQQVNANKEKSEEFEKFCVVFNLIKANTLLFNAVKGIGQPSNGNNYGMI